MPGLTESTLRTCSWSVCKCEWLLYPNFLATAANLALQILLCCAVLPAHVRFEQPHSRQPGRCRREDADRRLNLPGGQETTAAGGRREGLT